MLQLPVAVGAAAGLVFLLSLAGGVGASSSGRFALLFAVMTVIGAGLWLLASPRVSRHIFETVGIGAVLGAGLLVGIDQGLRLLNAQNWTWVIALSLAVATIVMIRVLGLQTRPVRSRDLAGLGLAFATAAIPLVSIFGENRVDPFGLYRVNGDAPYREAVSNSVHLLGANDSLLVAGGTIRYHWLGNGWVGAVTSLTDSLPFVSQVRFLPITAMVVIVLIGWAIAFAVTQSRMSALLGASLVSLGGAIGLRLHDSGGILTNSFGISMLFGGMSALACFAVWQVAVRERSRWQLVSVFGALVFLTAGARLTTGAVVVGSSAIAVIVSIRMSRWKRTLPLFGAGTVGLVGGYLLFNLPPVALAMDGTLTWSVRFSDFFLAYQGLLPLASPLGIFLALIALLLGIAAPLLGVLGLGSRLEIASKPEMWWGLGALLTGVGGLLLTYNFGLSHFTFLVPAMMPLIVLSGSGAGLVIARWWSRPPATKMLPAFPALAIPLLVSGLVIALSQTYGIRFDAVFRWAAPVVFVIGILVGSAVVVRLGGVGSAISYRAAVAVLAVVGTLMASTLTYSVRSTARPLVGERPIIWSAAEFSAGDWMKQNVYLDNLVATNRQCNYPEEAPPICVSTVNTVAAVGSRRALIEGAFYSVGSADQSIWPELTERFEDIEVSVRFGSEPSLEDLEYLWSRGVRFVWIDERFTSARDWSDYSTEVFAEDFVVILELKDPALLSK